MRSVHYLSDSGLVIGAQQGGAVRGDYCFAYVAEQFGKLRRLERKALDALQRNFTTVIAADNLRLDGGAGGIGRSIYVGYESNLWDVVSAVGRDLCHYVSVLVKGGLDAHLQQLLAEHLQEHELFVGAGLAGGVLVGLSVNGHVS